MGVGGKAAEQRKAVIGLEEEEENGQDVRVGRTDY